jgi:hypothetical protein
MVQVKDFIIQLYYRDNDVACMVSSSREQVAIMDQTVNISSGAPGQLASSPQILFQKLSSNALSFFT